MRSLGSPGIVAGVVLGVVATVAVPVLLTVGGGDDARGTAAGALALGDLPTGAAPRFGHLMGSEFHRGADRVTLALEPGSDVAQLVILTEGFLVATTPDVEGNTTAHALGADGSSKRQWSILADSMLGAVVGSADRRLGAVATSPGTVTVVQEGGHTITDLAAPRDELGLPVTPIAVTGTRCAGPDPDCAVVVNRMWSPDGESPGGSRWTLRPGKRPVQEASGIADVSAVASDGSTAGKVRVIDDGDGSCAGVAGPGGAVRWSTCEDRLISFSPDAASVLAGTSTHTGSGDHELTVLDAATGDERLRLTTAPHVGIFEVAWEDEDHLLAVVAQWREDEGTGEHGDHRWAIMRIGLDGTREYAVEPVPGDPEDHDGPLDLPRG